MENVNYKFHIPVMGTGHSIDTPIRVAHLGISSVMSIVDDILIERICRYYSHHHSIPVAEVSKKDPYARSKRITEYLNLVEKIVVRKLNELKHLPLFGQNEKTKYFELLPDDSPLKKKYKEYLNLNDGEAKEIILEEYKPFIYTLTTCRKNSFTQKTINQ
ncbi:MAG: hypothetical protein R6W68_03345 [Ignavibacteriaceae bacterium]